MSTIVEVFEVRPAEPTDLPAVAGLFAHYVTHSVATFECDPPGPGDWAAKLADVRAAGWPFLVGAVAGRVVGFSYAAPWRAKPAYRYTVESTVYLAPGHTGRGHGRRLLAAVLDRAAQDGARQVVAVIADSGDPASAALHRALGFAEAGRLHAVGHKHGRWLDVVLMQRSLPTGAG